VSCGLFCRHKERQTLPAGSVVQLPKSEHEQNMLHVIKSPVSVCVECGDARMLIKEDECHTSK